MRVLLRLAWRNIWRNTRRTMLTVVAIAFGIALIVVMRGLQYGTYAQMIETAVHRSTGHIQVHENGYWEKKTLTYAFPLADADTGWIASRPHVERTSPRLAADALIGVGAENTTGAQVVGIVPSLERAMTIFSKDVMVDGEFLGDADTTSAVIGHTMAKNLKANLGDELVLFTQGRDGSMAAAILIIKGIYRVGEPGMDGFMVFSHLALMQRVLVAEGRVTAVALTVDDYRNVSPVVAALTDRFVGAQAEPVWEVMSYETMLPALVQSIEFDNVSGVIFLILLLVVIAFGILNTILMSVMERFHEFGVMMAVGMRRRAIAAMIFFEATLLSFVGLAVGNAVGYAVNTYWQQHPIRFTGSYESIYEGYGFEPLLVAVTNLDQQAVWTLVVFALTLTVAMWPAFVAMRFRPVEAIRQG